MLRPAYVFRTLVLGMIILISSCGGGDPENPGDSDKEKPPATDYFAYVTQNDDTILQYRIGENGALTPLVPASVTAGMSPTQISVHPSSRYAYVVNYGEGDYEPHGNVSQYAIGADGALTAMTPAEVEAGWGPGSVVVHPNGQYAYVANYDSEDVSQYTIGDDGRLIPMSQDTVSADLYPYFITLDPSGRYAYVTNSDGYSHSVSQFTIGTDGALSAMDSFVVETGPDPRMIVVHPSGSYAYVGNFGDGTVSQYTLGTDGHLTLVDSPTVDVGGAPEAITFDASGRYAYVLNENGIDNSGSIAQFVIGPDGALEPLGSPVAAGSSPYFITMGPVGRYVYVVTRSNGYGEVLQYRIETNGSLTEMGAVITGLVARPGSIAVVARPR